MNNAHKIAAGILFTDQYQLTMAQLYYRMGLHEKPARFDHFFRDYPDYGTHKAGYCVNAGLESLLVRMRGAHFRDADIDCLKSQKSLAGKPLFHSDFLRWLRRGGNFEGISLSAVPEGRVVHANVPITVVEGGMAMAQILESALLNILNYQILIATKAARIRESGRGQLLLEFGLRRANDAGAIAGTRAALIGGADFSSNVGISCALGYPPKGTHAHSMVQLFMALGEGELEAFRAFAGVYPDDCLLLVDTINTLESGIPNAIRVFEELRRKGHKPLGVRLDSGDLAHLSIQASKMLDEAGFRETSIVLSNNLDELVIWQIITQIYEESPKYGVDPHRLAGRLVFGVGTRLITSHGESALGGVYKLVAVKDGQGWTPTIKISESLSKTPNPGTKAVWRIYDARGRATSDLVGLAGEDPAALDEITLHHASDHTKYRTLSKREISQVEPLLAEVLREGKLVYELPSIEQMRERRKADVERMDTGVKRIMNPHIYHVSLTETLWDMKLNLIRSVRKSG
ncbi:MAG: nicotinate phosphoribosyltransferase [Deltaproteobacteria bacterium]